MNNGVSKRSQQGSTLIAVLIVLILLTVGGVVAIRGSMTSLNIATNAQAQALLMQSSDAVFVKLEGNTSDALKFANMRIGDGMLAYILRPENKGKELVFCIRGMNSDGTIPDNFAGSRIGSVVYWNGSTIQNRDLGSNGFCKGRLSDFISGRRAVMTQVAIRAGESIEDWSHMVQGEDKDGSKGQDIQPVIVNVTSILPNLSSSSTADVNGCLSNYTTFVDKVVNNKTVVDCLAEKNVPYSVQEMEYTLRSVSAS